MPAYMVGGNYSKSPLTLRNNFPWESDHPLYLSMVI
jgi:hypothetical protein